MLVAVLPDETLLDDFGEEAFDGFDAAVREEPPEPDPPIMPPPGPVEREVVPPLEREVVFPLEVMPPPFIRFVFFALEIMT